MSGPMTIQQQLESGASHHQAGRLAEAERIYRRILAQQPEHAVAMHLLGVIAHQRGRNDVAVDLIRQALTLRPNYAEAFSNLGNALKDKGERDEAIAAFRQAIRLKPDLAEVHYNLGNALKDKEQLEEAIASYRQAIRIKPDYAEAYSNLANALKDREQLDEAIAAFRQAIRLKPDLAEAHGNLANALQSRGQFDEAITSHRQAIRLKPDLAEAHCNLGNALKGNEQLDEAIAAYRQAIRLKPDLAEAHYNLGSALTDKGQLEEAIAAYRQAIALRPSYADAHNNLGNALKEKGQLDEAIAAYRQAIALRSNYAEAYSNLGVVLKDQGQLDEAIAAYRQAIALKPNYGQAYDNLGTFLEEAGDFQEAERCYRQAMENAEINGVFQARLAFLLGRRLPEKDLIALKQSLVNPTGNAEKKAADLHYALAHVLDGRECYREAAEHLRMGNALYKQEREKKGVKYDVAAHAQFVSRMIDACSAEFFQRVRGMGMETQRPVFIIGLPRSGTTLTEQILAGHSQVFGAGELPFGEDDFLSLAGESQKAVPRSIRTDISFQNLSRLDRQTIQRVARQHLLRLDKIDSAAARIVDKMPENYLYLGLLAALFPQAKFIHCRRDLRDAAISCWMTRFVFLSWTNDLEHITTRFEQYRRLMQHWRKVLEGRWLDCDYEQTVADLPGMARRLVAWCGLEWEPACVDFHLVKRQVRTAAFAQVRQPISSRSVGRWKHYQELLAPVLARLS
jgi:tetratricopeptide (TPR) repeat protein